MSIIMIFINTAFLLTKYLIYLYSLPIAQYLDFLGKRIYYFFSVANDLSFSVPNGKR